SLVESIADMFEDASFDEDATPTRGLICIARPVALRRCITNLVQNAVTYGKKAHIGVRRSGDTITLTIRDEGPGIPQAKLDQVFASFVRLEQSRNRET
ncbi:ATP-binding protein, partial [Mesorhizobium sp. M2E.F.Ca.ET.154.01.1.1]